MAASDIGPRVIRLEPDGMNARLQYIRRVRLTFAVVALVLLAGCGGDDTAAYQNKPRPPAPINVTAAIDGDRVRVSPGTFGSGPVVFIISNQSGAPQTITFETDELGGSSGGITRSTPEIASRSTAQLKVDPPEGTYKLSASADDIRPAEIEVGARRESAQNELLQP
jgi:hypothetical protein